MSKKKLQFHDRLRVVADRLGTRRTAANVAGVTLDAIIRYLRGENMPNFMAVSRLCEEAGISMHWLATGEGLPDLGSLTESSSVRGFPITGFSETKENDWYTPHAMSMQVTLDIPDPKAFAAMVQGSSLVPEGLQPGFLCICSPMLKPVQNDIVHIRRLDGLCSLRVFVGEEKDWLILKGYTDRDDKKGQRSYEDRIKRNTVAEIAPVILVRRKV